MAGIELGTAYVSIIPSLQGLRKEMAKIHDVTVDVEANTKGVREEIQRATSGVTGNVKVEVHKSAFQRLKQLSSGMMSVSSAVAKTTVGLGLFTAAAGSTVNVLGSLGAGLATASGSLLALPAALGAGATAFAAIKVGATGFGETMKQLAKGDMEKFNEELAKLSPNAQRTALAIKGLGGQWSGLRNQVQDNLFAGFATQIKQLGGTYIPILRQGLGGAATQLNLMARSMGTYLQSAQAQRQVTGIMRGSNQMFANMRTALRDVVEGLLQMANVGANLLPGMGTSISNLAAGFKNWVNETSKSGQMLRWMEQGFAALANLGRVVGNVFMTVVNVFKAMGSAGGGLFQHLVQLTGAMKNWTASGHGQTLMVTLFRSLQAAAAALAPYITQVAQFFGQMTVKLAPLLPQIAALAGQFIVSLLPVLRQVIPILLQAAMQVMPSLTAAVTALAPGLTVAAQVFAQLLTAVAPLVPYIAQLVSFLLKLLSPVLQIAGPVVAVAIGFVKVARAVQTAKFAFAALNIVMRANPIGIVITAITALVSALVYAYRNSATFRRIVDAAFKAVGKVAKWLWQNIFRPVFNAIGKIVMWLWRNVIAPAGRTIGSIFRGLGKVISSIGRGIGSAIRGIGNVFRWLLNTARSIGTGIRNAWNSVMSFFYRLPGRIGSIFRGAGRWLWNAGKEIIYGLWRGIKAIWGKVTGWVRKGLGKLRRLFPFSPAKEGPFSGKGYTTHSGKALIGDWGAAMVKAFPEVQRTLASAMGGVQDTMNSASAPDITPKVNTPAGLGALAGSLDGTVASRIDSNEVAAAVHSALSQWNPQMDRDGVWRMVRKRDGQQGRR